MGGASAHRRGAHRARRGCTARPGGDQGDRPFAAARAVEGRVRRAARDERGRDRDDGAVDGRDSSAVRHVVTGPLLAIDGDSFAHRAYHALPKSINRNAVVGFTNMVVRLWEGERPRAVLVGWDSLEAPTYRHELLPAYQSGREFEPSILEQLALLPELCAALGFAVAKSAGYEADDFLAAAAAAEKALDGSV